MPHKFWLFELGAGCIFNLLMKGIIIIMMIMKGIIIIMIIMIMIMINNNNNNNNNSYYCNNDNNNYFNGVTYNSVLNKYLLTMMTQIGRLRSHWTAQISL